MFPCIKKLNFYFTFFFLTILAFATYVDAQPGEIDTTFNQTGFLRESFGFGYDVSRAVVIQNDGKIIAAGYAGFGSELEFAVVRYNLDGSLDNSFGENGVAAKGRRNTDEIANAVALQPDGKIIVVGESRARNYSFHSFAIARFNLDGSPDSSFGNNGLKISPLSDGYGIGTAVAVQNDGRIVVTGYLGNGVTVFRFNIDGSFDNSFGTNGKTTWFSDVSFGSGLAIQSDGKIVVGGGFANSSYWDFGLFRFNQNGSIDRKFGINGKASFSLSSRHDSVTSVAIQPDGKIVVVGSAQNASTPSYAQFAIARFYGNGRIDSTFGSGGGTVTSLGNNENIATSLALQSDGKILVTGTSYDGDRERIAIVRYKTDGTLDNLFGNNGIVLTYFQDSTISYSVTLQTDGKIIICGLTSNYSQTDFAVFRYNWDGSLDTTFGINGSAINDIGNSSDGWKSAIVQNDSKIVLVGDAWIKNNRTLVLTRLNIDGTKDNTFGENGKVTITINNNFFDVSKAILQSDGKILVCGTGQGGYTIFRFNSNGSLDETFGINGIKSISVGHTKGRANSLAIQGNGKILITGEAKRTSNTEPEFATIRCNSDGSLDTSFGENGIAWTSTSIYSETATAVKVQNDNKILVAGYGVGNTSISVDFIVTRYNSDGSLDNTFGNSGVVITAFEESNGARQDRPSDLLIQPDGRILVAGTSDNFPNTQNSKSVITRYLQNGKLDKTFALNGKVINSFGGESSATSLSIQNDGKILVGGNVTTSAEAYYYFTIARYYPNGILDESFGAKSKIPGTISLGFGENENFNNTLAIQSDGKIIGAGIIDRKFGIARFLAQ